MNENHEKLTLPSSNWADWFMMNRRTVALYSTIALIALIGIVWFFQARNARKIRDFETADVLAEELQKSPRLFDGETDSSQALMNLKKLDDEYAILQPRFDSLIAEEMLVRNKSKEFDPYAKRTIQRLRALGLTDYADFSEVSRLSGLGQYNEALQFATVLREKLNAKKSANIQTEYLLEGFLLLHMATLNQKLGNHEAMMQQVVALKEHLGLTKRQTPLTPKERALASQMLAHLQDRQSSLLDFIEDMPKATR